MHYEVAALDALSEGQIVRAGGKRRYRKDARKEPEFRSHNPSFVDYLNWLSSTNDAALTSEF